MKHTVGLLLILLVLISVQANSCNTELLSRGFDTTTTTSKEYNTVGFRCYKEKNYSLAASLFRCAIEKDAHNALAHYNLACMLALQILDPYDDQYDDEITKALKASFALRKDRFRRALNDQDLENFIRSRLFTNLIKEQFLQDNSAWKKVTTISELNGYWFNGHQNFTVTNSELSLSYYSESTTTAQFWGRYTKENRQQIFNWTKYQQVGEDEKSVTHNTHFNAYLLDNWLLIELAEDPEWHSGRYIILKRY